MRTRTVLSLLALILGLLSFGCATVAPYQREHLADRIMDPSSRERERAMERHWVETREGAIGGTLGGAGGCACN